MKRKPIYTALVIATVLATITICQSKGTDAEPRFRCKAVTVKLKGACPDSIEASVYDTATKDTLKYKFKTSGRANKAGQYCTMKADEKGRIISGQIIDASEKTIGMILLPDNIKPVIKYQSEF
ncbi:hypothetical protein [Mucilaginibacter dorajii]|uniref:Lipoprotein n=1 Tax=Mucilaginibacter dorajii TaxID=692994 RepID=A0ABP7PSC0_9SPHI|nr:hypothetical protein [Mucilaginibacter dorajii]MCS3736877.1 hypothetical protein [Mucilaginibacter dorajii]